MLGKSFGILLFEALTIRNVYVEICNAREVTDSREKIQPVYLPREDINALGVKYRRIPIMSIGRDIYCDTRLILHKLEEKFPSGALGASQPDQKAVEKLLENWTIDGGIFVRAAQVLPPEMPLLNDPKFRKDREDYTGRSWEKRNIIAMRPEGLTHIRDAFVFLETGLLADGRQWVLNTEKPSLADIEGWPLSDCGRDTHANECPQSSCLAVSLASWTKRSTSSLSYFEREVSQGLRLG